MRVPLCADNSCSLAVYLVLSGTVGLSDKSDKSLVLFSSEMFASKKFTMTDQDVGEVGVSSSEASAVAVRCCAKPDGSKLFPVGNLVKFRLATV